MKSKIDIYIAQWWRKKKLGAIIYLNYSIFKIRVLINGDRKL